MTTADSGGGGRAGVLVCSAFSLWNINITAGNRVSSNCRRVATDGRGCHVMLTLMCHISRGGARHYPDGGATV
jgi:hypothetical protein